MSYDMVHEYSRAITSNKHIANDSVILDDDTNTVNLFSINMGVGSRYICQ